MILMGVLIPGLQYTFKMAPIESKTYRLAASFHLFK